MQDMGRKRQQQLSNLGKLESLETVEASIVPHSELFLKVNKLFGFWVIGEETLTRANCYRKVREQVLILVQQHQRISSISGSAASADQQQQCISSISASAATVHQ